MPIDGLIILDALGRPIIQTNFRTKSPAYPLIHVDAFNNAVSNAEMAPLDPVIFVRTHMGPSFCCHVESNGVRILCPVSGDEDPLFAFAFMQTFVDILEDYLEELSINALKEHFDVIYELLEEMLDNGYPLTTERNTLRDIVIPPSILNKLMSVTGISGLANSTPTPFTSPIPWRKQGVKYNNNEIYFDVAEELTAIVSKNGSVLSSNVWGKIHANSRLSGTPDLLLTLTNPQVLQDCAFHSCVRLRRWKQDKALSFVPPDGQFMLMEYRHAASTLTSNTRQLLVPFQLSTSVTLDKNAGSLDITLTSRLSTRLVEHMIVTLHLGEGTSNTDCSVSAGASWVFDPNTLTLRWEIPKVPQGSSHTLRGNFTSTLVKPRPARAFRVTFDIPQYSYSALKVDQLRVSVEGYKPYKGVRGRASGDVEWRW